VFQSIKRYQSRGELGAWRTTLSCDQISFLTFLGIIVNESSSSQGYVHRYACKNLINHCSVAAPTVLRNEILEFSSKSWYECSGRYMSYIETILAFLVCIRKMVSPHHHFHRVYIIYQSLRRPSEMLNLYTLDARPPLRNTWNPSFRNIILVHHSPSYSRLS